MTTDSYGSALGKSIGGGLSSGLQLLLNDKMKGMQAQKQAELKSMLKRQEQEQKMAQVGEILGWKKGGGEEIDENVETIQEKPGLPPDISDEQIIAVSQIDPMLARLLQSQKESRFGREEKAQTREFKHQETGEQRAFERNKKYLEKIDAKAEEMPKEKLALSQMEAALKSGDYSSARNVLASLFKTEFGKSPSAQVVNSAAKQYLMSSLADITGRPNQFIEQQISKALLNPLYSKEANKLIYEGLSGLHNLKEEEIRNARELEEEYISQGKEIPRNFQQIVDKRTQKAVQAFEEEYEKQLREGLGISNQVFDSLPKPKEYEGKIIRDSESGKRYRSNGKTWKVIQ